MTRWLFGLAVLAAAGAPAPAQYPPQYGGYPGAPGFGGYPGAPGFGGNPGAFGGGGGYGFPTNPGFGGVGGGGFAPGGVGVGAGSPLSPYLNLLRNNPAVNYYNFARPGTAAGQAGGGNFNQGLGFSQLRQGFLPLAAFPSDTPTPFPPTGAQTYLASEAHPVAYGNRFGPLSGSLPTGSGAFYGAGNGTRNGFNRPPGQQGGQQGGQGAGTGGTQAPRTR